MWLNEKMMKKNVSPEIESGNITLSGAEVEAVSTTHRRAVDVYAPYGYSSMIPTGEEVLLVSGGSVSSVAGTKMKSPALKRGEVEIASKGGAKIRLLNDGTVLINGFEITKDGEIGLQNEHID